ncbi:GNAT family N-acetyltransferase [Jejuia pallidilutea]|uniref:Phosphinothricin N-acetyltransferase n=1 Tax=Jejuia pallidilutea TaxID=504487 RepID=A0A090VYZ0_9FLAO|nr:GNAT family N-acetyltransferase [Jejuia pallidilutea]GAL66648.1 phosphinothricin N-acetyltransferase [Jejuia pallidilutea]GAL69906.1 phosphinothricin N-acetyltransferase [Jejuia pallidilutea]GAL90926.1 phosphinothricin N-acetyltransferase [Jejuia pallidilutea]
MIRQLHTNDTQALLDIYNYYVLNSVVTFDIEPLYLNTFSEKINHINSHYPFLVYEDEGHILGFAYASMFRPKPAYNFTVESTVYVKHNAHGKQIGTKLYKALIDKLRATKVHSVLGVLTMPNKASVKLHEKFGFKKVAHIEDAGLKFDEWHDVGIWQLKL